MSILSTGNDYRQTAMAGLSRASQLESARETANKGLREAEKGQAASMAGTGAGLGLMAAQGGALAGMQLGAAAGPVGMVAGAAAGYLLSKLF